MPILPEEIATATFTRVHRQGYHAGEVDAFLRSVATDYGAALEKMLLTPSEPSAELDVGEEVNAILKAARSSAGALVQRAHEEAEAIQKAATEKAQGMETQASEARVRAFEQAAQEARDVKAEADRYAFELRHRTETHTKQMVETAEARARQLYAYNQQLSQHLEEIERLVGALRTELDAPADAWPEEAPTETGPASRKERREDDHTATDDDTERTERTERTGGTIEERMLRVLENEGV
ncbi:MAG: DivIVA domain-containing protein [Actinomycetota bacterium]|nr:DivIVA domain-containing protein [Actinomycetota bacterium]